MTAEPQAMAALRGYTIPLTPHGRSALVPDPPWHFSGDAIWISYHADPRACRALLPEPLELSTEHANASVAYFEWQWCTDSGAELADPGQARFNECLITIECRLGTERVGRVPFAWVDRAVPLVRGLIQGMPKLPGSVHMTRTFAVGRASAPRAAGGVLHGTLSAQGRRLIDASVRLRGLAAEPPPLAAAPLVHTRQFPGWGTDLPEQRQLVRSSVSDAAFSPVWRGDAELAFRDVEGLELAALAPVEVLGGYVFSYAETLEPGTAVTCS